MQGSYKTEGRGVSPTARGTVAAWQMLFALACCLPINAATFYTNLTISTYPNQGGLEFGIVGGVGPSGCNGCIIYTQLATKFTSTMTGNLGSIQVPYSQTDLTGPLQIQLATDSNGTPGTILETLSYFGPFNGLNSQIVGANSVAHPQLVQGAKYWVILKALPVLVTNSVGYISGAEGDWGGHNQPYQIIAPIGSMILAAVGTLPNGQPYSCSNPSASLSCNTWNVPSNNSGFQQPGVQ